jgi:FAD dependent oxidoreductase
VQSAATKTYLPWAECTRSLSSQAVVVASPPARNCTGSAVPTAAVSGSNSGGRSRADAQAGGRHTASTLPSNRHGDELLGGYSTSINRTHNLRRVAARHPHRKQIGVGVRRSTRVERHAELLHQAQVVAVVPDLDALPVSEAEQVDTGETDATKDQRRAVVSRAGAPASPPSGRCHRGWAMRVVVIGAGPTGLFTAMALARRGHEVTVVDRDPGPCSDGSWSRRGVMQFHPAITRSFQPSSQLAAGAREACLATMVANCVRRPIFSFRKTLRRWNSTVFVLRNSWLATSRLECPRATANAT